MMDHSLPLITTLATALGLALIMGFLAIKLKLPTLVGYLLAGVIIGPYSPGFVADAKIAAEFAEIGVMLLMFGVGLHFSLDNLLETRKIALPGAIIQILVATLSGALIASIWGWSLSNALVFGLALSVASTVVLIRALESLGLLNSVNGQIAVGWLVVEDIAMIVALVFLPFIAHWLDGTSVAAHQSVWLLLFIALLKIAAFIALMFLFGKRMLPKLFWHIARTGSRELFTLCVIAAAVGIAFAASRLFGISFALGAFFAGMIIRESRFNRRAAEESLPFRDAFAVLFFVSVGMLFNPAIFIEHPFKVLTVTGIIVIGKSIAAALLVLAFRYPLNTALIVSASLAQIGEFSFILAGYAVTLNLLPPEGQGLILAGALISIAINPLLFKTIVPLQEWLRKKSFLIKRPEHAEDPLMELPMSTDEKYLSGHVVLIGYSGVGKRISNILHEHGIPFLIVDSNREVVETLRTNKMVAVFGSGSEPWTMIQAHIMKAGMLVVATSDAFDIRKMLELARELNPKIELAVRVQSEEERLFLSQNMEGSYFLSEEELAKGISEHVLERFGIPALKQGPSSH